jgi:hypothetical protein
LAVDPATHEERHVARAKNTDRAEARRRHRAAVAAAEAQGEDAASTGGVATAALPRDTRTPAAKPGAPGAPAERPGIVAAFRLAAAPADVRGDIRAAPAVFRTTRSLWIVPALVIGGGVILLVPALRDNSMGVLAAQLLVVPPPLIPSFLAGMLAPRGSWLFGLLTGALAGIVFSIYVATAPSTGTVVVTDDLRSQALLYALVVSPLFGLATGAFAGFYRRFLRISGPQQQRKPAKSQKAAAKSGR